MVVFGLVSSAFDVLTFVTLRAWFGADAELFRAGWFVVSMGTELLAMLVLRTRRPFVRSRPGAALLWSSVAVATAAWVLPYTPLGDSLGFDPPGVFAALAMIGVLVGYAMATELAKRWLLARPATADAL
jgi:Mg2+-importing ATPase